MLGKLWSIAALGALTITSPVGAQDLPPAPGSTAEFQSAEAKASTGINDEVIDLFVRSCDKGDAYGCFVVGDFPEDVLAKVLAKRPNATRAFFNVETKRLLRQRCTPANDHGESCGDYSKVIMNSNRSYGSFTEEDGKFLTKRCLAGKESLLDCSDAERGRWSEETSDRVVLAKWVDNGFEMACKKGDSELCWKGFFRQYESMTPEMVARLKRLADASKSGCVGGSPFICSEVGIFLARHGNATEQALAADLVGMACKLPPKAGERDVQKEACENEKIIRAVIAKGK